MTEPDAAERIRTALTVATSLSVTADGHQTHISAGYLVTSTGSIMMELPAGDPVRTVVGDGDGLPAVVQVTDIAPVAMRRRVRARIAVAGLLAPVRAGTRHRLRFAAISAQLTDPATGEVVTVGGDDLAAAEPDPLAGAEAGLLSQLAGTHREVVDRLALLAPDRAACGAEAVLPLRIDRYGIVLRAEHADRDTDVRLPFATPLRTACDAPARMLDLLATTERRIRRPDDRVGEF